MKEKIIKILKSYKGDDIDLCYNILKIIEKDAHPENGLQLFFESVKGNISDSSYVLDKNFNIDQLSQWENLYSKYINEFLSTIIRKAHLDNWDKEKFYLAFWKSLDTDILFENSKIKAFVIFKCAQHDLMPFFEIIKPLKMDNERFIELFNSNVESIKKMKHILSLNFTQKTEISSLILDEIKQEKTFEEQSVILASALDFFAQSKINQFIQTLNNSNIQFEQNR